MKSFLKMFLAAFLAIVVFLVLIFFIFVGMVGNAVRPPEKASLDNNSLLAIDLSDPLPEQRMTNPLNAFLKEKKLEIPGLQDCIDLIHRAQSDDHIKGIYLKLNGDPNGYATNEALRNALLDFKKSGKFIYAYGDMIPQKAYYTATAADKIFLNPQGVMDFDGFSMQVMFLKGALDKLEIQPQIFYDGKFKSATEPLRETQMTEANKIQTKAFLGDLYGHFLEGIAQQRDIDTATLFRYANEGMIRNAHDALQYGLVDGLKYDDEVMDALRERMGLSPASKLRFISLYRYQKSLGDSKPVLGVHQKIAVLYAQGEIVDGDKRDGNDRLIAGDDYIHLIRKLRKDSTIKAIVMRVNSPGGSALASDHIWRELQLARQDKPVIVSMGDYAASGGYYISCGADSIFAEPNTLTGSIGVFGIIPNLQSFLKNKLGITFDGVKTAQYADLGTMSRPLTPVEQQFIQHSIDSVYATFKRKVAEGRHLPEATIDSIAQGRVWSGTAAVKLGLADRIGGLKDAVACAARMANLSFYNVQEYPQSQDPFQQLFQDISNNIQTSFVKKELGAQYTIYEQLKNITETNGSIQARLPYEILVR